MAVRIIDLEPRLGYAISGLSQTRSRSTQIPSTLLQRQRRDRRTRRFDSTQAASVFAAIGALSSGAGADEAIAAASGDETDGPLHWKYGGGN